MLDGTRQPVAVACVLGKTRKRVEVQRDVRDGTIGQHDPAMRCPGLHADLREAIGARRAPLAERAVEAIHERAQLLDRAVLRTDLSDLPADGDRDALRLEL